MFSLDFLQLINDWQSERISKDTAISQLAEYVSILPTEFKTCGKYLYRRYNLDDGPLLELKNNDFFEENYSSWTFDSDVAKGHKGGVLQYELWGVNVIFKCKPLRNQVFLNIAELFKSAMFRDAITTHQSQIIGYEEGIGHFGAGECEVILNRPKVFKDEIWSFADFGYSKEELSLAISAVNTAEFTQECLKILDETYNENEVNGLREIVQFWFLIGLRHFEYCLLD